MTLSAETSVRDDTNESRSKLAGVDTGVGEVLDMLRPMKTAIVNLQPEFSTVSQSRPLATMHERLKMAYGLWASITMADQANPQTAPALVEKSPRDDSRIQSKVIQSLKFEAMIMIARESQIDHPFPETFQWLLDDPRPGTGGTSAEGPPPPTKFKEWLESHINDTPFWVTGQPASGKSTLMKFMATNAQIRPCLQAWSGEHNLLTCSVYFWNSGSLGQRSQVASCQPFSTNFFDSGQTSVTLLPQDATSTSSSPEQTCPTPRTGLSKSFKAA